MEIERKFLIKKLPDNLTSYKARKIEQAYLCTDPVVRVRRDNDVYYLTYKSKGMIVRDEYNLPITKEAYGHLLAEVEFASEEEALGYIPPEWFGEDVSNSTKYHNSTLSRLP